MGMAHRLLAACAETGQQRKQRRPAETTLFALLFGLRNGVTGSQKRRGQRKADVSVLVASGVGTGRDA